MFLEGGFTPAAGDSFDLMDWSTVSGSFENLDLPALAADLRWNTSQLNTAGLLSVTFSADFDEDGYVGGDDLAEWRSDFGLTPGSDADRDGDSDGADFLAWQRQLGSVPAVPVSTTVPEPSTFLLALLIAAFSALDSLSPRGRKGAG